jgi:hypothetical protein
MQEPLFNFSWGANNNAQQFLTDCTSFDQMPQPNQQVLQDYAYAGNPGIAHACGSWTCDCYVTGYNCKGSSTSQEWGQTFNDIAKSYVSDDPATCHRNANPNATMKQVVSSFMRKISHCCNVPCDEAQFLLVGGKLTWNTHEVHCCSVNSIELGDLPAAAASADAWKEASSDDYGKSKTFNIINLKRAYKRHNLEMLGQHTLYEFVARDYLKKLAVPNFVGLETKPSWPLTESYSKHMLMLHHPWVTNLEEVLEHDGRTYSSYAEHLADYMYDPKFPQLIAMQIFQCKNQWTYQSAEGEAVRDQGGQSSTPVSQDDCGTVDAFDEAANIHSSMDSQLEEDAELVGLAREEFESLPEPPPEYDWSANQREGAETWLEEHKEKYYKRKAEQILAGHEPPFELFDTCQFLPSKVQGKGAEATGLCPSVSAEVLDGVY